MCHFAYASFTYFFIARIVVPFIPDNVFLKSLHWPMRCCISNIHKKRIIFSFFRMFIYISDGMVADCIGVVIGFRLILFVSCQRTRIIVAVGAYNRTIKFIEAPLQRPVVFRPFRIKIMSHMPFSDGIISVTGRFQRFRNCDAFFIEITGITFTKFHTPVIRHKSDSCLMRI